ncbi:PAS domain S-box protein [Desulfosarcina sp.]|uniref:PAS domain S-box protein n=1 Tax=Desulfosarcina sp. TaxID=2027861 RepID=UPI003970B170
MPPKPTYEELEKRVVALEAQTRRFAQVQAELKRSLNFTESLLTSLPTPIFYKDTNGRYRGCNAAFTEIMGVTAKQIHGKTVQDLWPNDLSRTYHQKDLELLEHQRPQVYEFEVKDKQGRTRPVIYYKDVFRDENGAVAGIVGGFVDISDIRRAQLEQQALFSMSIDMICIADINNATFLKVNPAFTATLGYSEAELLGVPFTDFIHPEDLETTRKTLVENLQKGEKVINFKNRYRTKSGEYRFLNWVSQPAPERGVTYAVAHDITEEIQAYETLRRQHDLLNSLFDNLPMGITIWDANGRLLMTNNRSYPQDGSAAPVFVNGTLVESEIVNSADGRTHDVRAFPIFDAEGSVANVVEFVRDITEIRKAQDEIRKRRQFLELVLYHAPDAIVTLDERHRVIDWNPGAAKMFGYTPEEAIGTPLDDLVARHQHHAEASSKTTQVLSGLRVESFETIRYHKDGTPLHVIAAGSPIMIEGELKGVVAVYTDITDRVRSEEALRTSHQRFLTVLDSIDATIYVADMRTHEILFMNKHMVETFGADLTGKICWQVFRRESAPCPNCTNDRLVDASGKPTGVVAWKGKNPVTGNWYMNYDRAIEWIDGRLARIQIATDITELMRLEKGLHQAQKMEAIGTLAGGIAHDFNNMLGAILGRTELMLLEMRPDDPRRPELQEIQRAAQRSADLTKQLLTFARKQTISPKVLELNNVVEDALKMLRRLIGEDIELVWHPATNLWAVKIDPTQVEQILANLCVNARDAIAGVGTITIETKNLVLDQDYCAVHAGFKPGEYVMLAVSDEGCGMDKQTLENAFEPFFTTKKVGQGTGLGLATVYGIVKQNDGFINVYSEPGLGTALRVYLPKVIRTLEVKEKAFDVNIAGGTETVLVVEDEESILTLIKSVLERYGYTVLAARAPSQALEIVQGHQGEIHLLLTDVVMPEMNGKELRARMVPLKPKIKVLFMSGYTADVIMHRGVLENDVNFIQKPFSIDALAGKVRLVLDESNPS